MRSAGAAALKRRQSSGLRVPSPLRPAVCACRFLIRLCQNRLSRGASDDTQELLILHFSSFILPLKKVNNDRPTHDWPVDVEETHCLRSSRHILTFPHSPISHSLLRLASPPPPDTASCFDLQHKRAHGPCSHDETQCWPSWDVIPSNRGL